MIEKIKPLTAINKHYNDDGHASWYAIDYYCPICGRHIRFYESDNACNKCGTFFDWGKKEPIIETTRTVVW